MTRKAKTKVAPKVSSKLIKKARKIFKASMKQQAKLSKIRAKAAKKAAAKKKLLQQQASKENNDVSIVVSGNGFEGAKRIDHLPLEQQIDTVFNPLHSITKTTTAETVSSATFIVTPKKAAKAK